MKLIFMKKWCSLLLLRTLQTHHVYSTLKRRGNGRFHVVSIWNTRGVCREVVLKLVGDKVKQFFVADWRNIYRGQKIVTLTRYFFLLQAGTSLLRSGAGLLQIQIRELRVQIHELRVQIHKLQVQIHELQVQIHEL